MCFFTPALPNVVASGFTDPTYRTSAESNASTITIPASAQENDYAILVDFASIDPGTVVPTDWTQLYTDTALAVDVTISWKKLTVSDPGATITGANGGTSNSKLMLVFNPGGRTSFTNNDASGNTTAGDPTSEATTTANSGATPLIVIGIATTNAALNPASFSTESPAFDATVAHTDTKIIVGYKIYTSSPANHTIDQADNGTGNTVHIHFVEMSA